MVFLTLLIIIFVLGFFWVRKRYSYFADSGMPHDPPCFPFGNLKGLIGKVHPAVIYQNIYMKFKNHGPVAGFYFLLAPHVIINDLDVIKDVLIKNFDTFRNRGMYYNLRDDPLSGHIAFIEDQPWRHLRAKLTPTFTSSKMRMMFETLLDVSQNWLEWLKKSQNLQMTEVSEILARFTTDVIGNVAFGLEMKAIDNPDSQFREMGKKLFSPENNFLFKLFFLLNFRDLGRKLRMKLIPSELSHFFTATIKENLNYRLENNIERNDFFNLLLQMYKGQSEEGANLTFNELAANCFIFFIGGFETASSTATFVLYHLAMNLEVQDRLRIEIKQVLAKNDGKIDYNAVKEMSYLQMVIDESLRLTTPISPLVRVASQNYRVSNTKFVIEKGTFTSIPIYGIHNDPEIYPNPSKFDPERFSEQNKAKRHPMAFLPFGEGPRNCIGLRFGLLQTKIALIQLLLNFHLKPTEQTPQTLVFDPLVPVLMPLGGMWLELENIN